MAQKKARGGGRQKGSKNLVRTDDYIINQYGVQITKDEYRRLQNAVRTTNRKRKQMEEYFDNLPLMMGKKQSPQSRLQLRLMGQEMDVMIRKRSSSVNRFTSREEFESYLKATIKASKPDYIRTRGIAYKKNMIAALYTEFGMFPDLVKGLAMKIQMMPQNDFLNLIGTDGLFEIGYIYSNQEKLQQLQRMREALGMNSPYDDYEDYEE